TFRHNPSEAKPQHRKLNLKLAKGWSAMVRLCCNQTGQALRNELTRPLDQVADDSGSGLDLVHQPNTLARQEIHGLDIPRSRSVRWEPHEPQHRYSLARNLGLAHHRFIRP